MKYEVILKIKDSVCDRFYVKYRTLSDNWEQTAQRYESYAKYHLKDVRDIYDYVVLVNLLDDNGAFIETIK